MATLEAFIYAGASFDAAGTDGGAGVALGGRNLETMSPVARDHLSRLTDAEIAALYAYLHTMPATSHD